MINLIDILTSGELLDWSEIMVIRGTPKDENKYIIVDDDNIIYKLSVKGIFPTYINNERAYFERERVTLDIINDIIVKGKNIGRIN